MTHWLTIEKETGRVVMLSEEKPIVQSDKFDVVEHEMTEQEKQECEKNRLPYKKGDNITFTDNPTHKRKRQKDAVKELKEKVVNKEIKGPLEALQQILDILDS